MIKDATYLEEVLKIDSLVFDKTGTEGKPIVRNALWRAEREELKGLLLSMEGKSEHPLAAAIVNYLKEEDSALNPIDAEGLEAVPGKGVKVRYGNREFRTGRPDWVLEVLPDEGREFLTEAGTATAFASDEELLGVFNFREPIALGSEEALNELNAMGRDLHLLSGDREEAVQAVSAQCRFSAYKAEVLLSEKVAMVGDGINDAGALAEADLGIAMNSGTDIAMDADGIILTLQRLVGIPRIVRISKGTVRTIKRNLFLGFAYNVLSIPIAVGILYPINGFLLNPMIAGAAMALSSLTVVGNSLLLKRRKQQFKSNINCGACIAKVTPQLNSELDIESWVVDTDSEDKILTVEGDVSLERVNHLLGEVGYEAKPLEEKADS